MVTMSNGAKVYIGELGNDGSQTELEDAFSYYGPIKSVWVARSPPGFAFVEFEDPRDARDSIRGLDGRMLCGHRVSVEMADGRGKNRSSRAPAPHRSSSRSYDPNDRCYECGERGHYAYDCRYRRRQGVRRSRSRSRGYDRRRSLSRDKRSRSYSRSRTPERRSRSPRRNGRD